MYNRLVTRSRFKSQSLYKMSSLLPTKSRQHSLTFPDNLIVVGASLQSASARRWGSGEIHFCQADEDF